MRDLDEEVDKWLGVDVSNTALSVTSTEVANAVTVTVCVASKCALSIFYRELVGILQEKTELAELIIIGVEVKSPKSARFDKGREEVETTASNFANRIIHSKGSKTCIVIINRKRGCPDRSDDVASCWWDGSSRSRLLSPVFLVHS